MAADLLVTRKDSDAMAAQVPLGSPGRLVHQLVGGVIGIPFGLGIVIAPHALLLGISAAAYCLYVGVFTAIGTVRMRRFAIDNNLALGALGRGQLAYARDVFARWAASGHLLIGALARHNLGWTLILEGRLDEAAKILEDAAEHHGRYLRRIAMLPTTRVDVALCHVLLGNLELAEAWCVKSAEPVKGPPSPSFPGLLALVRALIDCRSGRAAEATVALEHAWAEHEAALTGGTLRIMRVVRAFACAASEGPRSQGVVERVLGDMRPRYERELAFVGGTWPEMAAFLAAHQLDG